MIRLVLCIWALLSAPAALAERIVLGLSQDEVAITATFDGSDILVFGAVKREEPIPHAAPLHVVVTVQGLPQPITVRRKDHRFGIWVNSASAEVPAAPAFYAVATSAPLQHVIRRDQDARHQISVRQTLGAPHRPPGEPDPFVEALIRIRKSTSLYQLLEGAVSVDQQTLFHSRIQLPANLTEGTYRARIFLTREGKVVDHFETTIPVQKVGIERTLYRLAQDRPLAYGVLSLVIAIVAGWAASSVFRLLRI